MKRQIKWAVLAAGTCLVARSTWSIASYKSFQAAHAGSTDLFVPNGPPIRPHPTKGDILGRLEIPRLRLSVLVLEGDDEATLNLAAGHLPGTANLGDLGNTVIAGHRDMAFWPLRGIKRGDTVTVHAGKTYKYIVEDIFVVDPDDVTVVQPEQHEYILTLITCYPFRYIGSAPQRYIVKCKRADT